MPERKSKELTIVGDEAIHQDTGFLMRAKKMPDGTVVAQILVGPCETKSSKKGLHTRKSTISSKYF